MEWSDPASTAICGVLFVVAGFVLAITAGRRARDKVAPALASASLGAIGLFFVVFELVADVPSGWRSTIISRSFEVPIILFTSFLYMWIAGRFRMSPYEAGTYSIAVQHPRLQKLLLYSPAVLFTAWGYSLIAYLMSPQPELSSYAAADPQYFLLALPAALPAMMYLVIAASVFARAIRVSRNWTVAVKNGALSVALSLWVLGNCNALMQIWVQSFLNNPVRRNTIDIVLGVNDYLQLFFLVSLVSAVGLSVSTANPISRGRRAASKLIAMFSKKTK